MEAYDRKGRTTLCYGHIYRPNPHNTLGRKSFILKVRTGSALSKYDHCPQTRLNNSNQPGTFTQTNHSLELLMLGVLSECSEKKSYFGLGWFLFKCFSVRLWRFRWDGNLRLLFSNQVGKVLALFYHLILCFHNIRAIMSV